NQLWSTFACGNTGCGEPVEMGEAPGNCGIHDELLKVGGNAPVKVVQYHINTEELYMNVKDFIHMLYFRHLLVNPRDRRVVVVESVLCPSVFRETLARVFFKHFEVPSVLFAPSHLMAFLTLGVRTALVMDCGYTETLILPVCEGIPIVAAWEALPLGGKALHNLSVHPCVTVRMCFVSDHNRGLKLQASRFPTETTSERPKPPPGVQYPIDGGQILHIKGEISTPYCSCQCPIDMRQTLAENLLVTGGTVALPGLTHRLMNELRFLLQQPRYQEALTISSFRIHTPPAKPNYVAWLGGAIFGALQEVLGSRSVSRDLYMQTSRVPDWCSLCNPPAELSMEAKTPVPLLKRAYSTDK
uniref:Actin related protein 10 n=1 Tax=Eptatretus burgeri TaxID=7764 RepID=A0A8C4NA15_EPTBU